MNRGKPSVHVVTPSRGDRPKLFRDLLMMFVWNQSHGVDALWLIDYPPRLDGKFDIVPRVRKGMAKAFGAGADLVVIMEDDDYYGPNYVKHVVWAWHHAGRPEMIGGSCGLQYHIVSRYGYVMEHSEKKPSPLYLMAFSKMPAIWPDDGELHLDWHFTKTIKDARYLCYPMYDTVGIKHGAGLCGGRRHHILSEEQPNDPDGSRLRAGIGSHADTYLKLGDEIREQRQEAKRWVWPQEDSRVRGC